MQTKGTIIRLKNAENIRPLLAMLYVTLAVMVEKRGKAYRLVESFFLVLMCIVSSLSAVTILGGESLGKILLYVFVLTSMGNILKWLFALVIITYNKRNLRPAGFIPWYILSILCMAYVLLNKSSLYWIPIGACIVIGAARAYFESVADFYGNLADSFITKSTDDDYIESIVGDLLEGRHPGDEDVNSLNNPWVRKEFKKTLKKLLTDLELTGY